MLLVIVVARKSASAESVERCLRLDVTASFMCCVRTSKWFWWCTLAEDVNFTLVDLLCGVNTKMGLRVPIAKLQNNRFNSNSRVCCMVLFLVDFWSILINFGAWKKHSSIHYGWIRSLLVDKTTTMRRKANEMSLDDHHEVAAVVNATSWGLIESDLTGVAERGWVSSQKYVYQRECQKSRVVTTACIKFLVVYRWIPSTTNSPHTWQSQLTH